MRLKVQVSRYWFNICSWKIGVSWLLLKGRTVYWSLTVWPDIGPFHWQIDVRSK